MHEWLHTGGGIGCGRTKQYIYPSVIIILYSAKYTLKIRYLIRKRLGSTTPGGSGAQSFGLEWRI